MTEAAVAGKTVLTWGISTNSNLLPVNTNFWSPGFWCWEGEGPKQSKKHFNKHLSSAFPRFSWSQAPIVCSFQTQLPVFWPCFMLSTLQSLQWGAGQWWRGCDVCIEVSFCHSLLLQVFLLLCFVVSLPRSAIGNSSSGLTLLKLRKK